MKGTRSRFIYLLVSLSLVVGVMVSCGGPETKFEISSLTVTPSRVAPGQTATIEASVTNPGKAGGAYKTELKIEGRTAETKEITVGAGEKQTVSFQYKTDTTGKYRVELNSLVGTLEVLKPAEFQVTSLQVSPSEILAGKPVTVTAEIRNVGELDGSYPAKLTVDGKEIGGKDVSVAAGAVQRVSLTSTLAAGTHKIEIGGVTKELKALRPAELRVRSMKVTPPTVFPGQEATVDVEVANVGDIKGTLPATLTVNGAETDSRPMTLNAGANDKISFPVVRDLAGRYELGIGNGKVNLNVAEVGSYTSKAFNYSITYPKDWALNEEKPQQVLVAKTGFGGISLTSQRVAATARLADIAKASLDSSAKVLSAFAVLSQGEVNQAGKTAAYRAEFTYETQGLKVRGIVHFVKSGDYLFTLSGELFELAWDTNRPKPELVPVWEARKPLIQASIESFKPPVVAVGTYSDSVRGFSLSLAEGWAAMETGDRARILNIVAPAGKPQVSTSITIDRASQSTSAKDVALYVGTSVSRTVQSYKVISQNEVTLGEATRGYELLFSYVYQGTAAKMRVVSVVRGTQIFTLVVSGAVSAFDAQQPSHDQIIRSFTLVEPKPFGVSRQDSLFYRGGFIVTLDPALTEESPAGMVGAMFSGLVRHDSDLKMVPDMAEKWDVSADGKTYTFRLREGVKFHNGKPVIAADFKYSWERALDPKTESQKARSFLGDIVGASEMLESKATELSGVKVIDDRTLAVTIDGAKPYFLGKLAQPVAFVVDRANIARGKNWTNEPNGTGPFKLKQWKKDELLILERNDSFYRETARLKNVVFQLFAGRPMMMYENGEIDLTGVGTGDLERVEDKANPLNEELLTGKSFDINYVGFNVTKPPFDDPKVRRAFAMSLNMDKILEVTLKGTAERAGGFVPPGIPGYNPELKPLPFDPVQAKQLIAESKYGSVDSLPPVTLYVAYGAAPLHEAMAAMWKQNLGVELKIEAIREPKEYYEKRHRREFQLFTGGWRADYIDPQNFLEVLFQSQSDENASAYSNPEVDTALKEAAVERDEAKRLKKYQEIEKVILNDLPRVPLYHSEKDYLLVKPYVKGLHLYPIGVNHWNEVSVTAR